METKNHLKGVFIPCSAENVNKIKDVILRNLGYIGYGVTTDWLIFSKARNDFTILFDKDE